jgi:hypothetical protein
MTDSNPSPLPNPEEIIEKIDSESKRRKVREEILAARKKAVEEEIRKDLLIKLSHSDSAFSFISGVPFFLAPIALTLIAFSFASPSSAPKIDKKITRSEVSKIITNDGDLRAVKYALSYQPHIPSIKTIFSSDSDYYPANVALSTVLDDIRHEAFLSGDKTLIPQLIKITSEHEEINPFDNLQASQRDYFENIRIKTSDSYSKISNDVNNIADELSQKNQLVSEYLADSKMSFWISITALLLSVIIGSYQIFMSRPAALKKLFIEILTPKQTSSTSDEAKSVAITPEKN